MMMIRLMSAVVLLLLVTALTTDAVADDAARAGVIYSGSTRIYIPFTATDVMSGTLRNELYYRADNGEWARYGEAAPGINYFEFVAPHDGLYDFAVVSTDKAGNRRILTKESRGDASVLIDTRDPEIRIFPPGPDQPVYPGAALTLGWAVTDLSFKSARIRYSTDDGKTYKVAMTDKAEGTLSIDLPLTDAPAVKFQFRAMDHTDHQKDLSFTIPISPRQKARSRPPGDGPSVRPIRPDSDVDAYSAYAPPEPERDRPLQLSIAFTTQVGPSGLLQSELWYARVTDAPDWKKHWTLWGTSRSEVGRFLFRTKDSGQYAFYMVTQSNAGKLSKPRPVVGQVTEPDQVRWIDPIKPTVAVKQPTDASSYTGGQKVKIEWTAGDLHFSNTPIRIEVTHNNVDWVAVNKALPNTGSYEWTTPDAIDGTFVIRITASDLAGNSSVAYSKPFVVDTKKPEILVVVEGIKPLHDRTVRPAEIPVITAPGSTAVETARQDPLIRNPHIVTPPRAEIVTTKGTVKTPNERAWALFKHGAALQRAGRYDQALLQLRDAQDLNPRHAGIMNETGLVYFGLRDYRAAADKFGQAVEKDPRNERYRINQLKAYLKLKDTNKTAQAVGRLLAQFPHTKKGMALCNYVIGRFQEEKRSDKAVAFVQAILNLQAISDDLRADLEARLVPATAPEE